MQRILVLSVIVLLGTSWAVRAGSPSPQTRAITIVQTVLRAIRNNDPRTAAKFFGGKRGQIEFRRVWEDRRNWINARVERAEWVTDDTGKRIWVLLSGRSHGGAFIIDPRLWKIVGYYAEND